MPRDIQEMLDESIILVGRQLIVHGSDKPALDKWQVESLQILLIGGVRPQDFTYAIGLLDNPGASYEYEWDFICAEALKRRADINFEIAEAE
jgi:hypothetical protein